ncbi:DUF262 domain-containing protein [Vibrio harveyi]|nr:DUF262 domain-containing protein [Vibrio harveyi]
MKEIIKKFTKAQDSLVTQQSDFSLSAIADMVNHDSIDIAPHYQRRDRWAVDKQSALIESFLLNVPVPPVYLSEDDYGTYTVIDGKQRITAIYEFLMGKYKLKDLKELPELNGFYFKDLPEQLKRALSIRPFIRVITLLKQSNPELKYEVFLRLNTGGEKLKPQEIRNVAYSGELNDLLFDLSENDFLKRKMKITSTKSASYRNMDDLELVLRFFTIQEGWERLGKKISIAMDDFMSKNRNPDVEQLRAMFNRSIFACEQIWGQHAFEKPQNGGWRDQLITPLYDAQMVAITLLDDDKIEYLAENSDAVLNATAALYSEDKDFLKSVSQATGDTSAINIRVSKLYEMLVNLEA